MLRRTALLLAAALLAGLPGSGSAATAVPLPEHDAFYRWSGALDRVPPGTPLRTRTVTLAATTTPTPVEATQVLYRTTDTTGRPAVSVTTVVLPTSGTVAPKVVAYLSFYDAFTSRCDPSFTLRGGDSGAPNAGQAQAEQAVVHALRADGYVVTVPDFENTGLHFLAGTESGMSTLDGIRATLAVLELGPSTPVGMMGYSGGSIAAGFATELAPRYAPGLHLVGTALGGVPVDLGRIVRYVDGDPRWSSITPAVLLGAARAYHLDLSPYLSPLGAKVVRAVSHQCIAEFPGSLTLRSLLKPRYGDLSRIPALRDALGRLVMGSGRPAAPVLVAAGNLDGTGDGVTIAADQRALARRYCDRGVPATYEEVPHGEHTQTGFAFMPQAFAFLASRFAGVPVRCLV